MGKNEKKFIISELNDYELNLILREFFERRKKIKEIYKAHLAYYRKFKRDFFIIDRKTNVSKLFWFILKKFMEGEDNKINSIYQLSKEEKVRKFIIKNKNPKRKIFPEIDRYLRSLESAGFITLEEGEKGRGRYKKRKIVAINKKINYALLSKYFITYCELKLKDDDLGKLSKNPYIAKEKLEIFTELESKIPDNFFLNFLVKEDIDNFIEDRTDISPLAEACRHILFLVNLFKTNEFIDAYLEDIRKKEHIVASDALIYLMKITEASMDKKTMLFYKEKLHRNQLIPNKVVIFFEENYKKWEKEFREKKLIPLLELTIKFFEKNLELVRKGEIPDFLDDIYMEFDDDLENLFIKLKEKYEEIKDR